MEVGERERQRRAVVGVLVVDAAERLEGLYERVGLRSEVGLGLGRLGLGTRFGLVGDGFVRGRGLGLRLACDEAEHDEGERGELPGSRIHGSRTHGSIPSAESLASTISPASGASGSAMIRGASQRRRLACICA